MFTLDHRQKLHKGLIEAFKLAELERMLYLGLDIKLEDISEDGTREHIFYQVIKTSEQNNWTLALVHEAYYARPNNKTLESLATELKSLGEKSAIPIPDPVIDHTALGQTIVLGGTNHLEVRDLLFLAGFVLALFVVFGFVVVIGLTTVFFVSCNFGVIDCKP